MLSEGTIPIILEGDALLKEAVENNNHEAVRKILEEVKEKDRLSIGEYHGSFLSCIAQDNFETVQVFLEMGFSPSNAGRFKNRNFITPLQIASENLSIKIMKLLLDKGADINATDEQKQTCLHWIVKCGNYMVPHTDPHLEEKGTKCLQLVLSYKHLNINVPDYRNWSALVLAAIQGNDSYVTELVNAGAELIKKTETKNKHHSVRSPLYWILRNCSQGMLKSLDKCLVLPETGSEENQDGQNWGVDFRFFTTHHQMSRRETIDGETKYRPLKRNELRDQSLLMRIQKYAKDDDESIKKGVRNFLDHPVTQMYVRKRWAEVKWIFYTTIMLMHFIYSSTLTLYTILVFHDICPLSQDENYYSEANVKLFSPTTWKRFDDVPCPGMRIKGENFSTNPDDWGFTTDANWAIIAWICLIIFTIIVVFREFVDFIDQKVQNFYEIDTWIHIGLVVSVAICLWHSNPFDGEMTVKKYQHHAAVWGTFLTWIQMSLYMERLPKYGIYLLMLRKVAKTFLKLTWSYLSMLLAFGFTFYLIFPSQYYFQNDLPSVFVKMVNMMSGEVGFDDLYYPYKMVIQPTNNNNSKYYHLGKEIKISIPQFETVNGTIRITGFNETMIPNLFDADVNTSPKPPFFPGTGMILVLIFMIMVPIVALNLLQGLAVEVVQGFRGTLECLQMNQQIIQIHWIDALINSNSSFYWFFKFLHFLNPSYLWQSWKVSEDNSTKIIDLLHNPGIRKQINGLLLNPEDNANHKNISTIWRNHKDITLELRCKLDNLCLDLLKRKEVQLDDKQTKMMATIDDLRSMVEQLLLAQKGEISFRKNATLRRY